MPSIFSMPGITSVEQLVIVPQSMICLLVLFSVINLLLESRTEFEGTFLSNRCLWLGFCNWPMKFLISFKAAFTRPTDRL